MDEKKKTLVILGFLGLIILLIIGITVNNHIKNKKLYEKFEAAFNGSEPTLVYIGKTGCSWCNLLNPSIAEMKDRYQFDYIYINMSEMSNTYFNQVMDKLGLKQVGTPYLAVVKDGKVIDKQPEYVDYDKLFAFLQKNEIIDKEAALPINFIDLKEYQELLAGSEKSIIVIGQSTCPHCIQAKLTLNQIADEEDIVINYLNISYLSDEEGKTFESSLDYFKKDSWGTPLTLIVQDGKMIDVLEGNAPKAGYLSFFEEQGVL